MGYLVDVFDIPRGKVKGKCVNREKWKRGGRRRQSGERKYQPDWGTFPAFLGTSNSVVMWVWSPQSYVDLSSFLFVRIRLILSSFERGFPVFFF